MKKLMLLAALLAMVIVAAVPAIAQIEQDNEQEADSGELNQSSETVGGGDNSIQCSNDQLTGNTGNAQVQNNILQYASSGASASGDASIEVIPNEDVDEVFHCAPQVNQAASAAA